MISLFHFKANQTLNCLNFTHLRETFQVREVCRNFFSRKEQNFCISQAVTHLRGHVRQIKKKKKKELQWRYAVLSSAQNNSIKKPFTPAECVFYVCAVINIAVSSIHVLTDW